MAKIYREVLDQLEISNINIEKASERHRDFIVYGSFTNNSEYSLSENNIIVSLYTEDDRLIQVMTGYIKAYWVGPGETVDFKTHHSSRNLLELSNAPNISGKEIPLIAKAAVGRYKVHHEAVKNH